MDYSGNIGCYLDYGLNVKQKFKDYFGLKISQFTKKNKKVLQKIKKSAYIYNMGNTPLDYKEHKVLNSQTNTWGFKETRTTGGITHILKQESFENMHPFYAQGICGASFKTYKKTEAQNIDIRKGVECLRCMIKAGYIKKYKPLYNFTGTTSNPKKYIGGYEYKVLFNFINIISLHEEHGKEFKVNEIIDIWKCRT